MASTSARLLLGLALGLLLGGAPARADTPPPGPSEPPAGGPEQSGRPLDVPAPILVPEPLVEPPSRTMEPLPAPQRARRMRLELVVGGTGLLLSVWAADRLLARDLSSAWPSWLPLAGPFYLVYDQRRQSAPSAAVTAFLVIDGLAQVAGATMAVLGLVLRKERVVLRLPARPPGQGPGLTLSLAAPGGLALTF